MDILANKVNNFRQLRRRGEFSDLVLYRTLCTLKTDAACVTSKDKKGKAFFLGFKY